MVLKPDYSVINCSIRNLLVVFISFTFNNTLIAADTLDNNESKRLYESVCTQCHGLQMIEKTRNGRTGWENTVHKMVVAGAQLTVDEMESVIDYLSQRYGPSTGDPMTTGLLPYDSPLQTDGTITSENINLPLGKGRTQVQAYCHLCHDLGRVVATRRSADEWRHYTLNMIARGEITITREDLDIIVSYLNRHFGKSD